jgi:hypothetical protein
LRTKNRNITISICIVFLAATIFANLATGEVTTTQTFILDPAIFTTGYSFAYQEFAYDSTITWTITSGSLTGNGTITSDAVTGSLEITTSTACTVSVSLINAFTEVSGIYQTSATTTYPAGSTVTFNWLYTIPVGPSPTPTPKPTAIPTLPPTIPTNQVWLYVNQSGSGTTNPTAGYHFYTLGQTIAMYANPAIGYAFNYWLLDNGTQILTPTFPFYMNTNHTALAVFQEIPVEGEPTPAPTVAPTPIPTTPPEYPDVINVQPFWVYLTQGNLIGLINALFLSAFKLQSIVVGVLLLVIFGPLYIKSRNLLLCSILWILLGAIFVSLVPDLAGLAVILLILGVASLLYKLVRPD